MIIRTKRQETPTAPEPTRPPRAPAPGLRSSLGLFLRRQKRQSIKDVYMLRRHNTTHCCCSGFAAAAAVVSVVSSPHVHIINRCRFGWRPAIVAPAFCGGGRARGPRGFVLRRGRRFRPFLFRLMFVSPVDSLLLPSVPCCRSCGARRVLPASAWVWSSSSSLSLSPLGASWAAAWSSARCPAPACPVCGAPRGPRPSSRGLRRFRVPLSASGRAALSRAAVASSRSARSAALAAAAAGVAAVVGPAPVVRFLPGLSLPLRPWPC